MVLFTVIFTSTAFWRRIDITLREEEKKKQEEILVLGQKLKSNWNFLNYTQKRKKSYTNINQPVHHF